VTQAEPKTTGLTRIFVPWNYEVGAMPPDNMADAVKNPSTRVWSAEDGAYVVATQSDLDNPFQCAGPGNAIFIEPRTYADLSSGASKYAWATNPIVFTDSELLTAGVVPAACHVLPFDTCGAILTGLNQNSSIQVTVRYYIERIPTTVEEDLLSLARPAPAYDSLAMELYSKAMADLPVGVPVGENPIGEWFNAVIDTVAALGPKVGSIMQNIGTALGGTSSGRKETGRPPKAPPAGAMPHNINPTPQRNMTAKQKARQAPRKNLQRPQLPEKTWTSTKRSGPVRPGEKRLHNRQKIKRRHSVGSIKHKKRR